METMEIYVVERWERWEHSTTLGMYQIKSDAEYIRDHCEALEIDSFVMRAPAGNRDELSKNVHWLDEIVGFSIHEDEVFL